MISIPGLLKEPLNGVENWDNEKHIERKTREEGRKERGFCLSEKQKQL